MPALPLLRSPLPPPRESAPAANTGATPSRLSACRHANLAHPPRQSVRGMEAAGAMILEGAPSAELKALLDGIADIDSDAGPKFTPDTMRRLVGLIVGRAYAPPLLELCHLMRVAALAPRGKIELFFWGVPAARASAYAGWVRARTRAAPQAARPALHVAGTHPAPAIEPEPGGVAIVYADGRFGIAYGRMPLLAALMEFLVSSIGYAQVLERVERLLAGPPLIAAAGEAANEISRTVYAWLTPHLPTAHEKRRLEALLDWLLSRPGAGADAQDFSTDDIDDATVLAFWLEADLDEFRTFAAVLRGFLLLIEAMEDAAAATAVARAARIGADAEAGEIDIAVPAGGRRAWPTGGAEPDEDPLAALAEPPAERVKLLNGRERAELDELLSAGPRGELLPLSLARRAVFGGVQARISEALRRGGLPSAARILAAVINGIDPPRGGGEAAEGGYGGWCARAAALEAHLERAMLASLHVLARAGRPEAIHLLLALGGTIELPEGAAAGHPDDRMAEAIRRLQDPAVGGPGTAALMLRARRSFQGFSRAGFDADAPSRPEAVDAHAAAAAHLPHLAARLARARAALARRSAEAWAAQQETDRRLFAARFARIYGLLTVETSS
jgi:hypothetical protein